MKVLLLNQFFHPDLSATAQMLTDLAEDLAASGLEVTALAARGSYLGGERLPARDHHRGVAIRRLWATSLGKRTLLHRALDYGSFYASAALALATMPRHDVVVALTTPPLIAAAGLVARGLRGSRLVYWVQDLYPEVAVAFGVMRPRSPAARVMGAISRAVLSRADAVVALGEEMRRRCIAAGAAPKRTAVIPNWSDGAAVRPVPHPSNPLRAEMAAGARCLVAYSGNIGRGHDVETLVGAARALRERRDIAFLFVGDGARRGEVERAARDLPNLRLGSYQPRERLAESLSAADLHLVSLDPPLGGLIEPSKLYGIMAAGRPALFVGPAESEVARTLEREGCGAAFRNGDVTGLAAAISALADDPARREELGRRAREALLARYDRRVATARFRDLVRSL
jgi:glycosyltransferase involved in cell wall biosynthesis